MVAQLKVHSLVLPLSQNPLLHFDVSGQVVHAGAQDRLSFLFSPSFGNRYDRRLL
jgi:hypothetical protein